MYIWSKKRTAEVKELSQFLRNMRVSAETEADMKGLLIKDFYIVKGYLITVFVISVAMTLFFVWKGNWMMMLMPLVYMTELSLNPMAYDERGHFDLYQKSLPIRTSNVVIEKYVLPVAGILFVGLVYLIANLIKILITGTGTFAECFSNAAGVLAIGLFCVALMYPWIFKLGVEKGRLVYIVVIILLSVVCSLLAIANSSVGLEDGSVSMAVLPGAGMLLLAALLTVASVALSIRFYTKREF